MTPWATLTTSTPTLLKRRINKWDVYTQGRQRDGVLPSAKAGSLNFDNSGTLTGTLNAQGQQAPRHSTWSCQCRLKTARWRKTLT
ncbi:Uncharacterised protein [Serratia fonticola]|uniref:Uncharacterized protein n=1 Tax=Serratia fonticola TaxID=47917 RepID=A0A4U9WJQ3_SERFO|nr:Uncharacterised protein [Serratia fonticola]